MNTSDDLSSPTDVFADVVGAALLATGRRVDIRSAVPDDLERVRAFYDRLDDTSTYFRFFGIRQFIPEAELRDVVAQRTPRHVTLLASFAGELIGIGEFIVGPDPQVAELAFVVSEEHHHEGVATLLLERLAIVGRRCGLTSFVATTMFSNQDMRLVFRTVGLTHHSTVDDGVVTVTLDLTSLDQLEARAAARRELAARAANSLS